MHKSGMRFNHESSYMAYDFLPEPGAVAHVRSRFPPGRQTVFPGTVPEGTEKRL